MSRERFWFFYPLRVRYAEVDCHGVVFNANYLMYFDSTITEYFRALGYDQSRRQKDGSRFPRRQIAR
jgi:acyl-CoA thioester hydrolase